MADESKFGFTVGDYVEAENEDYDGETFVVKGFSTNLLGSHVVQVSRPENRDEEGYDTIFYPHELALENWREARDED